MERKWREGALYEGGRLYEGGMLGIWERGRLGIWEGGRLGMGRGKVRYMGRGKRSLICLMEKKNLVFALIIIWIHTVILIYVNLSMCTVCSLVQKEDYQNIFDIFDFFCEF